MQRLQCPIHNDTIETLLWSKMSKITTYWKVFNSVTVAENPHMEITSLKKQKNKNLILTSSDNTFTGADVNRSLPSLHEITLLFSLIKFIGNFDFF